VGKQKGLLVSVLELQSALVDNKKEQEPVSSSRVRQSLRCGDIEQIRRHLDRPYSVILPVSSVPHSALHSRSKVWEFAASSASTQLPCPGEYHVAIYLGAVSVALGQGRLLVSEADECSVSLDQPLKNPRDGYFRIELLEALTVCTR
jgi:hypothetical protein